jgi:hypothetical protein
MNETTLQTKVQEDLWTACTERILIGARVALDAGASATRGRGEFEPDGEYAKSPLQMVVSRSRSLSSNAEGPALIRLLIERGADPNACTSNCDRGIDYGGFDVDNDLPLVSIFSQYSVA